MQDAGHAAAEAFGDALASCRGPAPRLAAGRGRLRVPESGGQAILTLRALMQSGRFDSAWELLSGTDRREVTIPDNVAPFPCKQAA